MALVPHWKQPSHPEIQEVIINEAEFTSKSLSRVTLPPFALYAKLDFPPCTRADEATYATVQMGNNEHLNLNSDLLYINHSCEPSVIFDTANRCVIAGPKGLQAGEELTFFYPSTEWHMAQPFDCLCGKPTCRGRISGAKDMTDAQLEGVWLNGHIRDLLLERKQQTAVGVKTNGEVVSENGTAPVNGHHAEQEHQADQTTKALEDAVLQAEKVVEAARHALFSYIRQTGGTKNGPAGAQRRGPTSRELSGEMGGDTNGNAIAV
ncbi:histone-lysine N-methyltransferase ash1 [Rhypophila decipiens]|uniref:Histone-lysine N-methyltransferase ash1 n=1 Tax=Rhypophila decipiens TaxID=261697 RepID=A0AAN6Y3X5_9PEZI|nr:histone-lysine N-methyltransferase ash1 [Rhypophila decipiens]